MKKIASVYVEENLLKKAREMGINISRFLEENLRKVVGALGAGFEPAWTKSPAALEAAALVLTRPSQQS